MTHYLISEASRKLSVEAHVLRYWEEELKLEIPRNELGHRYYTEKQLALFQRIKELKELGYQLKAIKTSLKEEYGPAEADEAGFLLSNIAENAPDTDSSEGEEQETREDLKGAEKRFQVLEGQTGEKTAEKPERPDSSARAERLEKLSGRLSASASGPMTEAVLEKMTGRLAEGIGQAGESEEAEADRESAHAVCESVEADGPERNCAEPDKGEFGPSEQNETKADQEEYVKQREAETAGKEDAGKETARKEDAGKETALDLVGSGSLTASPEKMQQFQTIMTDVLAEALRRNQDILSKEVGGTVSEKLVKEMNYLMRDREEREEERYRKLDETIRACQRVQRQRSEAAATRVPVRSAKKSRFPWGRRKDS